MSDPLPPPSRLVEATERLDVVYTAFNAQRSMRALDARITVTPRFAGTLHVIIDPTRPPACAYNRVLGLREAHLDALDEVLAPFEEAGLSPRIDVAMHRLTPAVGEALTGRGFVPRAGLTWLVASPAERAPVPGGAVTTRRLGEADRDVFFGLIGAEELGGPFPPEVVARRQEHYCTDTFRAWAAFIDGRPIASATLFVAGRQGVLANAYTRIGYRGRGAQRALFEARLADAAALGLEWVATDVLPGTTSHANAERAGFRAANSVVWFERPLPDDAGD